MSQGYARWITKLRWPITLFWIALTVVAMLWFPQLQTVVSHQSTTFLPSNATAMTAQNLANQVNPKYQAKSTVIVAIRNPNGLTSADKQYFLNKLDNIDAHHGAYQVNYVQDTSNVAKDVASRFVSHDGTTEIATIGLPADVSDPNLPHTLDHLKATFSGAPASSHIYFTGDVPIQVDDIQMSQSGADKTAVVTVILVLIILLIVFRSIVTPFVTLLSIGLSYLISAGIVAFAAEHGLPVSTFTQTFLIAVLFGAGTDYSIILLNRFREELTRTHDRTEALAFALRGVSKTVLFSSLTVLISFAVLYFAKFGLYRSAVGVALGIFITLLVCLTFIPALMSLLGGHLYWPRRPKPGMDHRPSRIWGATSSLSTRRPWWVLLALIIVLAPIAMLFSNDRTFDPMQDIPTAPSVQGFQAVSKSFGSGQAMPTTVVLKAPGNLRSQQGLATIQQVTKSLASVKGVKEVDSATQPLGKLEKGFEIANQNKQAAEGLGQVNNGLSKLSNQLSSGSQQVGQATSALSQLQSGSAKVTSGANSLASGAKGVSSGLQSVQSGLKRANSGANSLAQGVSQVNQSAGQLSQGSAGLADALSAWAASHPDTQGNPQWAQIMALAQQLQQGSKQLADVMPGLQKGAQSLATATGQLSGGVGKLQSGAQSLTSGANQLAGGSSQVTSGIAQFQSQMNPLASGLSKAASGAAKLQSGVGSVQSYLNQSNQAVGKGNPGFYVPSSTIQRNSSLQQAMDAYISPDGHIAKWTVVLNQNPYSMQAIQLTPTLQQAAQSGLKVSPLHSGTFYLGGTTATQAELNQLSSQDFTRTMILIFCAIFILLVLMLRSILAPLYILASLAATYFVTMGILQTVTIHILHHSGIAWAVPFFVFLLLVALGVDYSIFLMSRFDEARRTGLTTVEAMRQAMAQMGNVVFSAAVIMMGTFGSLIIAGITTTTEIGLAVIIGLFLYAAVLLAFFVPSSAAVMGEAHNWPFDFRLRGGAGVNGKDAKRRGVRPVRE